MNLKKCEHRKLSEKIKYWRYLGYEKEKLAVYEMQIARDNWRILKGLLSVAVLMLCMGFLVISYMIRAQVGEMVSLKRSGWMIVVYLILSIGMLCVCCVLTKKERKVWYLRVLTTFFLSAWSLLYIVNGTINNKTDYAVMACGSFLLIQIVFDAYPEDNLLFASCAYLLFAILSFTFKSASIFVYDMIDSLPFFLVGNYLSWHKAHSKWTSLINMDAQMELEKEKMQNELNKNRISVMLSQIQPHFLYNSLATIAKLCDKDPKRAKQATLDFSEYLRGNMNSLTLQKPIPFEKELEHLNVYLSLEKIRFGEMLHIVYHIETTGFMLPALTVQPIVENAVKYGVGLAENGGTVTIETREENERFVVVVRDDGVGFDPMEPKRDGRTHIGIENVRARLEAMIDGTLIIKSEKGVGTTVKIYIPKGEREDGYNSSR